MRIGKYPCSLVANMGATPAFFDMIPALSICKTGSREFIVRISGSEKKHVTVVLSATTNGTMLPPMLIFKGKTDKTIKKLRIPEGFIIKTQEKLKYVREVSKQLGFDNSILTFDALQLIKRMMLKVNW